MLRKNEANSYMCNPDFSVHRCAADSGLLPISKKVHTTAAVCGCSYTFLRAASRSAIMSSARSIPADSRKRPSVIPTVKRCFRGILACVIEAECCTNVATSPSETANEHNFRLLTKRAHSSETLHLSSSQIVLRMGRQTGIVNCLDFRVILQELRDQ